jgi:hypothetical protein
MFYVFRFNKALLDLGFEPKYINQTHRVSAQATGRALGYTPEEAALLLLTNLPPALLDQANPKAAEKWIRKGKVNPNRDAIREALGLYGWFGLQSDDYFSE